MRRSVEVDWDDVKVVHVTPNYGKPHDTDTDDPTCWCVPEVEKVPRDGGGPDGTLIKHREAN